jgi:hypothetical protein
VLRNQGVGTPASAVIIYRCSDYTGLNTYNLNNKRSLIYNLNIKYTLVYKLDFKTIIVLNLIK